MDEFFQLKPAQSEYFGPPIGGTFEIRSVAFVTSVKPITVPLLVENRKSLRTDKAACVVLNNSSYSSVRVSVREGNNYCRDFILKKGQTEKYQIGQLPTRIAWKTGNQKISDAEFEKYSVFLANPAWSFSGFLGKIIKG